MAKGRYLPKELQELKKGKLTAKGIGKKLGRGGGTIQKCLNLLNIEGMYIGKYKYYTESQFNLVNSFIIEKGERLNTYLQEMTSLDRYGVRNPMQSSIIKNRLKVSIKNKYGVEHYSKTKEFKESFKNTCLEKYGVENVSSVETFKKKREDTCLEKYNNPTFMGSDIFINKSRKSTLKKYGVENPFQSEEIKDKIKATNLEKYGCEYASQNKEIREKITKTNLERYGETSPLKNKEIKNKQIATNNKKYGGNSPTQSFEILSKGSKKYTYDNKNFDSFPEVAFYIWLKDNDIEFEYHPNFSIPYIYKDKEYRYFPDFKVGEEYIEIKANFFFESKNGKKDFSKMICPRDRSLDEKFNSKYQKSLSVGVKYLFKDDYKIYVNYVNKKYGYKFKDQCKNN